MACRSHARRRFFSFRNLLAFRTRSNLSDQHLDRTSLNHGGIAWKAETGLESWTSCTAPRIGTALSRPRPTGEVRTWFNVAYLYKYNIFLDLESGKLVVCRNNRCGIKNIAPEDCLAGRSGAKIEKQCFQLIVIYSGLDTLNLTEGFENGLELVHLDNAGALLVCRHEGHVEIIVMVTNDSKKPCRRRYSNVWARREHAGRLFELLPANFTIVVHVYLVNNQFDQLCFRLIERLYE